MSRLAHVAIRTAIALALLVPPVPIAAASRPAVRGEHGMVVAPEPIAAGVGRDVLRRGGTAVDAAVAAAFALAVTYPRAGNLGGGGFLLVRENARTHAALDFRERAPAALRPELFLDDGGRPVPERSLAGGLSVGVPGSVAGLAEAHRRWGSLSWRDLLAPAIRLAREGVAVSAGTERSLADAQDLLRRDPATRAIFFREGRTLREGERLVQADLARTLERIARRGAAGFYTGDVAASVVEVVRRNGGVMTARDLSGYRALLRTPLVGRYRGARIVTFPPPSSGGVVLLQILGMLERFDLRASGPGASATVHRMVEASRRAYADRSMWLGDPDAVEVPTAALLEPAYLAARSADIDDARATPSGVVQPGQPAGVSTGGDTLHLSVADARGRVVALTTTLNSWYGSGLMAPGTGVILNNEIDDFAIAPGVPNQFGLVGGRANEVAGGKRPLSSMCPTIVEGEDGARRPRLVLGSPGGSTIITAVLQVLSGVLDHGMPLQEAVDAPRFHHQWLPDRLDHEVRAFPADVAAALRARGHTLAPRAPIGNVAAIGLDEDGAWLGAADPRGEGVAAGY